MTLTDPVELLSLEEIAYIDKQRSQAIESLEISNNHVKCRKCNLSIPIVGKRIRDIENPIFKSSMPK
jgi:hypothetical protein